jgi:hypothetical protein
MALEIKVRSILSILQSLVKHPFFLEEKRMLVNKVLIVIFSLRDNMSFHGNRAHDA